MVVRLLGRQGLPGLISPLELVRFPGCYPLYPLLYHRLFVAALLAARFLPAVSFR